MMRDERLIFEKSVKAESDILFTKMMSIVDLEAVYPGEMLRKTARASRGIGGGCYRHYTNLSKKLRS